MPAQQPVESQSHLQASGSALPDALQEDLFVMTASGGLVRHKLRLQPKGQAEADLTAGDRYNDVPVDGVVYNTSHVSANIGTNLLSWSVASNAVSCWCM